MICTIQICTGAIFKKCPLLESMSLYLELAKRKDRISNISVWLVGTEASELWFIDPGQTVKN